MFFKKNSPFSNCSNPITKIKMMSKMLFCFALATASVNADSWDLQEEDVYGEPRLLDSVFNNTSIDMNSILALILIGVLFLVTSGGSFLGGTGYSRNSYQQQGYYDYNDYYNQDQFYKRAGGVDGKFLSRYLLLKVPLPTLLRGPDGVKTDKSR